MSKLAFLDPSHDEGSEPVSEAPVEAAPAAEAGQPRDEGGRFASKEPKAPAAEAPPEPQPETPPAAPAATAPVSEPPPPAAPEAPAVQPGHVPLAALLDTRDKVKDLERELAQYRAQAQPQPEPEQPPDPYQDLEGFLNWQRQQTDAQLWNTRLEMSRGFAEAKHGPEKVQAAIDWGFEKCGSDPFFNQQVRQARDPVGFVVSEHQRQQLLSELSDPSEIEAFRAWKQAQVSGQPPAAAATPPTPAAPAVAPRQPPPPPPASIAAATSAGEATVVPTGPGQAFSGAFHRT